MTVLEAVLLLLAGVGVFIAGMNMLGDGLEKSAGGGLKRLLGKISGNRFAGVGVGAGATAIIQSSSATSVMVIGFVNAGIMTLFQATAIIMGANIGTTITGILVSLKSLPIADFAMVLAFIGVMMMFIKKDKAKQIGGILCGFGLIFVGLDLMGSSLKKCDALNDFFKDLFTKIDFPLLLILCGALFTALIQSSSAATGIFISMVGSGALSLDVALFLVLGSNIGTCITAVLACMGAGVNAKRTALIHLSFNVIGTVIFTALLWPLRAYAVQWLTQIPGGEEMQLAWFHVIFNVSTTLLLLPFIKQLVAMATKIIPERKAEEDNRRLKYVDERLLTTPPVAIMQVKKEVEYMADLAKANLEKSFEANFGVAKEYESEIAERESTINFTNKTLTRFLIKLSPLVDNQNEKRIGAYFHVLNDLERIGDHAENFGEIASEMQEKGLAFSSVAVEELKTMQEKVLRMFAIATEVFDGRNAEKLTELTALENEVDALKRELTANHYKRLADGECKIEHSPYFSSTVAGLERVADHLVNVGYSILNPTGSQSDAKIAVKAEN
ncbi:MAG: Na/Pi cotransporter family protein [Clostridiales bacterium]|nr:Na/Pi cotransporter family protein [Clostridiales bacterium]